MAIPLRFASMKAARYEFQRTVTHLYPELEARLLPRVDQFLNGIPEEHRRFPPARLPKARMHAWLAIQEAPGKPLGQAVTAKYLDAKCEHVTTFLAWIQRALVDP